MGIVSGIRILNNLLAGTLSGAQLQTVLTTPANLASFTQLLYSPRHLRSLLESSTAVAALAASNAALGAVFNSAVARRALFDTRNSLDWLLTVANAKTYLRGIVVLASTPSATATQINGNRRSLLVAIYSGLNSWGVFAGVAGLDTYNTTSTTGIEVFVKGVGWTHRSGGVSPSVTSAYIDME